MKAAKLTASDVMTRSVIAATAGMSVTQLLSLMLEHNVSGLPVLDDGDRLVGVVTEGDLLRRAELGTERDRSRLFGLLAPAAVAQDYVLAHGRRVGEIMTRDVAVVAPETSLDEIVQLMEDRHIKRVPVVEQGRVAGIVSRADVLKALLSVSRGIRQVSLPDNEICAHVVAEIRKQPWHTRNAGVTVKDGVVHLNGVVNDHREHMAMRIAAANAPGARGIRDELQCIEPISGLPIESAGEAEKIRSA